MNNKSEIEIERRFLISDINILQLSQLQYIDMIATYIRVSENECERIRVEYSNGLLRRIHTHKKRVSRVARIETENIITQVEADTILQNHSNSKYRPVIKRRYILPYQDDPTMCWEIDIFHNLNEGLQIVEIEIPSEDFDLIIPDWVGEEITQDNRFNNDQLSIHPYTEWK